MRYKEPLLNDIEDYAHLLRSSYGPFLKRVAVATRLLRMGATDCRAFDNCFEMGDGESVALSLALESRWDVELRERIRYTFRNYPFDSWLNLPAKYPHIETVQQCAGLAASICRNHARVKAEANGGQTFLALEGVAP